MNFDEWKLDILKSANTKYRHIFRRESVENDFNWDTFKKYFDSKYSANEALRLHLIK